ncbi:hypothetical protein QTP86_001552 [Hemibagrus guttatus]|nr:hypothetical protein QTP86_001552 [Hemibagrus guttatus]
MLSEVDVLLECVKLLQSLSQYREYLRDLPRKTMADILNEVSEQMFEQVLFSALQEDLSSALSTITNELSRYGRLVSPIKRIPLGCKSSLVKHLVSFRRMVYMVFKEEQGILFGLVLKGKVTPVFLRGPGARSS